MDEHEAVVDVLVALGGVRVHHIQLSPQVVPVLSPAVVGFQPTSNSPVCMLLHIHVGLNSPSWYLPVIVNSTIAVHAGLRVQICIPNKCSSLGVITHLCRYRHNPVGA